MGCPRHADRREAHRKRGGATYRIVRYADDFVIMVHGTQAHADALWDEVAEVIAPLGLRLSAAKSRVCHLDEGFDFLGFHIQRRRKKGTSKTQRLHLPVEEGLALDHGEGAGADTPSTNITTLADLLGQLNAVAAGMVQLLPARRVHSHVPLPRPVRLASGHPVAAQTAPRDHLEGTLPSVPDRQAR